MKTVPKFPLIMTIAAFVCFLLAYGFLLFFTIIPPYTKALFLLIPALVLGLITWLTYLGKLSAVVSDTLTAILSVIFILASIFYTLFLGIFADLDGTKDLRYYEKLYDRIEDRPGMENFPDEVPESEGEILFSWNPQFLQGGEQFCLKYTPDLQTLTQYREDFPEKSQWSGMVKDADWTLPIDRNCDENDMLYMFFWDGGFNHMELCYACLHTDGSVTFYYTRG